MVMFFFAIAQFSANMSDPLTMNSPCLRAHSTIWSALPWTLACLADLLGGVPRDDLGVGERDAGHVALQAENDVLLGHANDGLLRHQEVVFDALDTGIEGPIDGIVAVGVHSDVGLVILSDLNGGLHLVEGEVDDLEGVVLARHTAARHRLEEGGTATEVPACLLDHFVATRHRRVE